MAAEATIEKEDSDLAEENADLVDAVGQDKSFDSLASFTDDVTTKVGSVKDGVSSGVTVSHDDTYANKLLTNQYIFPHIICMSELNS